MTKRILRSVRCTRSEVGVRIVLDDSVTCALLHDLEVEAVCDFDSFRRLIACEIMPLRQQGLLPPNVCDTGMSSAPLLIFDEYTDSLSIRLFEGMRSRETIVRGLLVRADTEGHVREISVELDDEQALATLLACE